MYLFDKNLKPLLDQNDLQEPDKSFFTGIEKFNDLIWTALEEKFIQESTDAEMEAKKNEMQTNIKPVTDFKDKVNSKYQAIYDEIADKVNKAIEILEDIVGLKRAYLIDRIFFDGEFFRNIVCSVEKTLQKKRISDLRIIRYRNV